MWSSGFEYYDIGCSIWEYDSGNIREWIIDRVIMIIENMETDNGEVRVAIIKYRCISDDGKCSIYHTYVGAKDVELQYDRYFCETREEAETIRQLKGMV